MFGVPQLKKLAILLVVLIGCQSQEFVPKTSKGTYYPLIVGTYWEYDVVETTISQVNGQMNSIYELRMEVTDSAISAGETTYILKRYTRSDAALPWDAQETWSVRLSEFQLVQQEGNIPFIKLKSPLSDGKSWNGNELNNLGGKDSCGGGTNNCDVYTVTDLTKAFEISGNTYSNSVNIIESNEDDPIIGKDVRKSVYAESVGLVYRELTQLIYCTVGDCIGEQVVENGILFKQTLKAYGTL